MEQRSEQLGANAPDLHSQAAGTDPNTRDQREREDRGPGAHQHLGAASERTFGGGQDDEDSDDPFQSGRSKGGSWCSGSIIVRADHY